MMRLGTSTIIENVIQNFRGADVADITVVTGYKAEILEKYLAGKGIDFCFNCNFAESHMMDSICLGLRQLGDDFDYVLITPGDVPLVKPETIRAMLCCRAEVVRVSLGGKAGHPVMLSKGVAKEILNYQEDGGLRSFLEQYRDVTAYVNV
ncbi:MAG: NTP transferase domain-containing protein, partial [Oscillospiraceae bacterium]|nr:NTP transferase domain-containing protein [Oscillospiraceae bacterium]